MIQLGVPDMQNQLRPRITVFGVGGAGGNAVNNMIRASLEGVEFVVANSDAQALSNNLAERKLQLGVNLTRGLGAGAKPDIGRASAEEQIDEINAYLEGTNMAFITAGMGGGTGTGAAPVIARAAREQGILTVGVVTKPFHFEGSHRMRMAEAGLAELQQYVDTLIIIPNQNLFRIANERTTFADAFRMADEVLHSGVRGVTDLMVMPGLINLDFADIRSVMSEMGKAMMGTGEAAGEKRSISAAESAIANPLLDDVSMKGARGVLINITGGYDMTLFEVDEAANRIREEVDPDANIIFGSTFDEKMEGKMRVSVVATGIDVSAEHARGGGMPAHLHVVTTNRVSEPRQAAQEPTRFNPGFTAPAAAQQKVVQAPNPPMHQQSHYPSVAQQQPQPQAAPSFSAPFNWGISGSKSHEGSLSHESPNAAALSNLLEKAKIAEAVALEAASVPTAPPPPTQQQMQMPINAGFSFSGPTNAPVAPSHAASKPQAATPAKRSSSLFGFGTKKQEVQQPAAPQSPQPNLDVAPSARPRTSEEETLEIPAFLRRQTN